MTGWSIIRAVFGALVVVAFNNTPAMAQDNAACDAACNVPCYFGECAPAKASYDDALERCDVKRLELVSELYRGTASGEKAREAIPILRARGYGTSRIGVTPNDAGQSCTALVEGTPPPPPPSPATTSFDAAAEMWRRCDGGDEHYCSALAEGSSPYAALAKVELAKRVPTFPAPLVPEQPLMETIDPQAITECDRLAANPEDEAQVMGSAAIQPEKMDAERAILVCKEEKQRQPNNMRIAFQLGMALFKEERAGEGIYQVRTACDGGYAASCTAYGLTMSLSSSISGVKNYTLASALFQKACDGGNATGCTVLGIVYAQGQGGAVKDTQRARALYLQGCNGGHETGCDLLESLEQ